MNTMNLNMAIERISSINWSEVGKRNSNSHIQLVREYLRRASIFHNNYPGKCLYPFLMISNSITSPKTNIEEIQILYEVNNSYHRALVTSYLELNALIDEGNQVAIDNKDLFEPVIKLYERGGIFYRGEGGINVNGSSFPFTIWANLVEIEPVDITDATLDKMDESN